MRRRKKQECSFCRRQAKFTQSGKDWCANHKNECDKLWTQNTSVQFSQTYEQLENGGKWSVYYFERLFGDDGITPEEEKALQSSK